LRCTRDTTYRKRRENVFIHTPLIQLFYGLINFTEFKVRFQLNLCTFFISIIMARKGNIVWCFSCLENNFKSHEGEKSYLSHKKKTHYKRCLRKFHCCLKTFLFFLFVSTNKFSSFLMLVVEFLAREISKKIGSFCKGCQLMFLSENFEQHPQTLSLNQAMKPVNFTANFVQWRDENAQSTSKQSKKGQWNLRNWKNLRLRQNATTRSIIDVKKSIKLPSSELYTFLFHFGRLHN
jgi:hypothetical protein